MMFINPKIDFSFQKIFGSDQSKDIIISFLNAVLYNENSTIKNVEIFNRSLIPTVRGIKDTCLDVRAKLNDDTEIIVKMQLLNGEGFEKRILHRVATAYSIQGNLGEDYKLINPVIVLTITDLKMFDLDGVISRFIVKAKDYLLDDINYDLELVFVELSKFNKEVNKLETLRDKWFYFFNQSQNFYDIPSNIKEVTAIKKALEIANENNFSQEEIEDLRKQEILIYEQRLAMENAVNQAIKKTTLEIAQKLIGVLDDATISQTTGLTLEEINSLK
jgi:predicted transposase/invertase (TIGR01784 family)